MIYSLFSGVWKSFLGYSLELSKTSNASKEIKTKKREFFLLIH